MIKENMRTPRTLTYEKVYKTALALFDHDPHKTNSWWLKKQEALDGLAPYEMVKCGKSRKLMKIMERCIL